jgi:hypothetical protein
VSYVNGPYNAGPAPANLGPLDRDATDETRRTTLLAAGWVAETLSHPDGRDVERWFGPAPRENQPHCGLGLGPAWLYLCVLSELGIADG